MTPSAPDGSQLHLLASHQDESKVAYYSPKCHIRTVQRSFREPSVYRSALLVFFGRYETPRRRGHVRHPFACRPPGHGALLRQLANSTWKNTKGLALGSTW